MSRAKCVRQAIRQTGGDTNGHNRYTHTNMLASVSVSACASMSECLTRSVCASLPVCLPDLLIIRLPVCLFVPLSVYRCFLYLSTNCSNSNGKKWSHQIVALNKMVSTALFSFFFSAVSLLLVSHWTSSSSQPASQSDLRFSYCRQGLDKVQWTFPRHTKDALYVLCNEQCKWF